MRSTLSSIFVLLAIAACSADHGSSQSSCDEFRDKDSCLSDYGCAWGTDKGGAHCFYVGDVRPL